MKLKRLLVTLKLPALFRICRRQIKPVQLIEMAYMLRIEDLRTREIKYQKYNSMDEIVKYVYFDVPLTVPNYTSKKYSLVHKNLSTGREHVIQLKTAKRIDCEYDNWHGVEII